STSAGRKSGLTGRSRCYRARMMIRGVTNTPRLVYRGWLFEVIGSIEQGDDFFRETGRHRVALVGGTAHPAHRYLERAAQATREQRVIGVVGFVFVVGGVKLVVG